MLYAVAVKPEEHLSLGTLMRRLEGRMHHALGKKQVPSHHIHGWRYQATPSKHEGVVQEGESLQEGQSKGKHL